MEISKRKGDSVIRKGTIEDAEQIAGIKINNYKKTYMNIFPSQYLEQMTFEEEKQKYAKEFLNRKVLIYYENDKILGYIYYGKRKNHQEKYQEHQGEIYAIYVDINMRNCGIGTKLIQAALKDLINDYESVILWCASDNTDSMNFYNKRNFKQIGEIKAEIGKKEISETTFVFNFNESNKYKLTRYVSYKEKDEILAIYANFDLMFFKNETIDWFNDIANNKLRKDIPIDFYRYLIKKEVITFA